jgi:hypothetical protein
MTDKTVQKSSRVPHERRAARTSIADSVFYGQPWDTIEKINELASRLVQHPPEHPEERREEIVAKVIQIQYLAAELLVHMPKENTRRGAVGIS